MDIREQLEKTPQTESELVSLNKYVKDHKQNLADLSFKQEIVSQYMEILENNNYKYDQEELMRFFLLYENAPAVERQVTRAKEIAGSIEIQLIEKLNEEKAEFADELKSYKTKFEVITMFNDYGDQNIQKFAKEADKLNRDLINAKQKAVDFNKREQQVKYPETEYDDLDQLIDKYKPYLSLWQNARKFQMNKGQWVTSPLFNQEF